MINKILLLLFLATGNMWATCTAATCARVLNPFTGKLDFVGDGTNTSCINIADTGGSQWWSISVNSSGSLVTTLDTSNTSGCNKLNRLVLKDESGSYYTVTINTSGTLITTSGGSYASSVDIFPILGTSGITWILSVDSSSNLVTS